MRFTALFPALLAVALGSPMLDSHLDSLADGEVHIFKRDAVISPRDVELAKRNDVNLEESESATSFYERTVELTSSASVHALCRQAR